MIDLLVTIPAHNGQASTHTLRSVWRLAYETTIKHDLQCLNRKSSFLYRQLCAERFFESKATHWLSLDADIGFEPRMVESLISAEKGVICGLYAYKDGFGNCFVPLDDQPITAELPVKIRFSGLGAALISRAAIELMAEMYPRKTVAVDPRGRIAFHLWFETLTHDEYLEPDYAFLERYVSAGGEVWGFPTSAVWHE